MDVIVKGLPWVLSALTIASAWLTGQKRAVGWAIAAVNQVCWAAWIVLSGTWGMLPMNIFLAGLSGYNFMLWRRG